jgi:hypothetical protein
MRYGVQCLVEASEFSMRDLIFSILRNALFNGRATSHPVTKINAMSRHQPMVPQTLAFRICDCFSSSSGWASSRTVSGPKAPNTAICSSLDEKSSVGLHTRHTFDRGRLPSPHELLNMGEHGGFRCGVKLHCGDEKS